MLRVRSFAVAGLLSAVYCGGTGRAQVFTAVDSIARADSTWRDESPRTREANARRGVTPTVHVTASRLDQPLPQFAGNVFVLSQAELQRLPGLQSGTLLQGVPGIHLFDATGNGSRYVVSPRGFAASGEAEYVELLVDGIPANELQKGLADFDILSKAQLGRIEVLRGPASALYGDQATAGVVHLASRPRVAPWVASHGGSWGRFDVETGGGYEGPRGYFGASLGWLQSDGWRDNSRWQEWRLFERGALRLGRGQIASMSALGTHYDRHDPGPLPRGWLFDTPERAFFERDRDKTDRLLAGVRVAGPLGAHLEHSSRVYVRGRDADLVRSIPAGLEIVDTQDEELSERTIGAELQATARGSGRRVLLQMGFEVERGTLDDTHFAEIAPMPAKTTAVDTTASTVRRVKLAPYAQSVIELPGALQLSLGTRYDVFRLRFDQKQGGDARARRTLQRFSPRTALNWRWSRGNVFVSGSGVFKIPTLDQLYDLRRTLGFQLSNPDLEPQHGTNVELGTRILPDERTFVELVLYRTWMRDEVSFALQPAPRYYNVGVSDHTGAEVVLRRQWTERLLTMLSYTWNAAFFRSDPTNGKRINGIPEHRAVFGIDLVLPLAVGIGIAVEADGRQFLDEMNEHELPAYTVANLRVRRSFRNLDGYFEIDNVFDRLYGASGFVLFFDGGDVVYPGTARNFAIGIDLRR